MPRRSAKDREDTIVEITHKHVPRELEDFQVQRRQRFERSYEMTMDQPTIPGPIEAHMQDILDVRFKNERYDPEKMKELAADAAEEIKKHIIEVASQRVRVVVHVMTGEATGQAVRAITRCLWDPEKDRSMRAVVENQELFAVASAFALYYE
ncbi:tctex1 domain-containing protein 1-like [Pollicipes pollicipes]|uniref:tctex1 domain-containing protein 1-like n=1 Tax=Pollicipes pollicipes TaxID=41117 RepID=UPI0018857C57|nr:tctex1 domain-containing protein 1-like [Pollicipes pollicipes]